MMGIAAAYLPCNSFCSLVKDRIAFTESLEYRYECIRCSSLLLLELWTRSENFNSYTQMDANITKKQTATASFAIFPQKLDFYGLNTFTPQESTPNLHQRGYQAYLQHRYVTDSGNLLTSQVSFRKLDADLLPNSAAPYRLLVETTKGGFFNHQDRNTTRKNGQKSSALTRVITSDCTNSVLAQTSRIAPTMAVRNFCWYRSSGLPTIL